MHERLFENTRALAPAQMAAHAQAVGLDAQKFSQCLDSGRYAAEVRADMADAAAANVPGTPGFIVGLVNPKDPKDPRVRVFRVFTGAQPYAVFKATIDAALAAAEKQQ